MARVIPGTRVDRIGQVLRFVVATFLNDLLVDDLNLLLPAFNELLLVHVREDSLAALLRLLQHLLCLLLKLVNFSVDYLG